MNTLKKDRDELLFQRYVLIIKRHGKYASKIPRSEIYEEAGRPWCLKRETVGKIIIRQLRNDKRHIFEDDDDLRWMLDELDKIAERRG